MRNTRSFSPALVLWVLPLHAQDPPQPTAPAAPGRAAPVPATPPAPAPALAEPAPPPAASKPPAFRILDDGLLLEDWFGVPVAFTREKDIDFIWIKPGLSLAGRQVRIRSWEKALTLREGRDENDLKQASELTYMFPLLLRNTLGPALGPRVTFSSSQGDFILVGRLVDSNAGSRNAKFFVGLGVGSSTATWDLKLVDSTTNELVMAVHHRAVSGSAFTEVQDKVEKWCRKFAQFLAATVVRRSP